MTAAFTLLARDLRLALRRPADSTTAVAFFVIAAALFPFGIGADPALLARVAPGVIWVTALLATLLSLERLFLADYEDGSLDQLALSPLSLIWAVLAKAAAHWLAVGLPLLVAAPILALLLGMVDGTGFAVLLAALLLGTPTLVLIGTLAAALTVGARRGGALLALLALPLDVPVLIFGAGSVEAAVAGAGAGPHLQVLAGLLLGALVLAPVAAAAALRQAVE